MKGKVEEDMKNFVSKQIFCYPIIEANYENETKQSQGNGYWPSTAEEMGLMSIRFIHTFIGSGVFAMGDVRKDILSVSIMRITSLQRKG